MAAGKTLELWSQHYSPKLPTQHTIRTQRVLMSNADPVLRFLQTRSVKNTMPLDMRSIGPGAHPVLEGEDVQSVT